MVGYSVFEKFASISDNVHNRVTEELRKAGKNEADFHQKQIDRIQAEYNKILSKIERLQDLLLDQSITKDDYDKKLEQLKDRQYKLSVELDEYTKADHEYHLHVSTIINLSRHMQEIFESSELLEKRAILGFLLQNPTIKGKKLEFTLRKPFDTVLELANRPVLLRGQDSNLEPSPYT